MPGQQIHALAPPLPSTPRAWRVGPDRALALDEPVVMGILNVTPDSFSDGGRFDSPEAAAAAALDMIDAGASIIDVGGESARPGATRVPAQEQIRRTVPVIKALRRRSEVLISIDTTRRDVAQAALDAGAQIVNDVSAGGEDERMLSLAAERACGLILMHRLRPPEEDQYSDRYATPPDYDDVVLDVRRFLAERCAQALAAGVQAPAIVIDPGLGFGKTVAQNFQLIARIGQIQDLGYPVLSAASRKSFLGAVTGVERSAERLCGSVAVSLLHWQAGVRIFRVHDVAAHAEALAVAQAVAGAD